MADGVALAADVRESSAGIVVPCEARPLAEAIDKVLADSDLRRLLSLHAKRLVRERYSLASMTSAILALYDTILCKPQGAT
jgi:glycosyltransferase involved in cell wall biosynthesis